MVVLVAWWIPGWHCSSRKIKMLLILLLSCTDSSSSWLKAADVFLFFMFLELCDTKNLRLNFVHTVCIQIVTPFALLCYICLCLGWLCRLSCFSKPNYCICWSTRHNFYHWVKIYLLLTLFLVKKTLYKHKFTKIKFSMIIIPMDPAEGNIQKHKVNNLFLFPHSPV